MAKEIKPELDPAWLESEDAWADLPFDEQDPPDETGDGEGESDTLDDPLL